MKSDGNGDDIPDAAGREPVVDWPEIVSGATFFGSPPEPSPLAPGGDIVLPEPAYGETSFEELSPYHRTLH